MELIAHHDTAMIGVKYGSTIKYEQFSCPGCGAAGAVEVPAFSVFPGKCPTECGVQFVQRPTYLRMVYEMKPAGKWMCQAERKAIMAHLGENIIADCVRRGQHDDALRLRRQKDSGENAA